MQSHTHEALTEPRVVLAALVASAVRGRPWQPLPVLCEATAAVHGLRRARPATLSGLAELISRGAVDCRVVGARRVRAGCRPGAPEFRAAIGPDVRGGDGCRVAYAGEGRWTVVAGPDVVTGVPGLEDATWVALDLIRSRGHGGP